MKLYDTMTTEKRSLGLSDGRFGLYVCGLTVYDEAHIGHLRCMMVFDLLVRVLRAKNIQVNYVRNITDVDDKIIKRANELGVDWQELTESVIAKIQSQEDILSLVRPDHEPRASAYIAQMIAMIEVLINKGHAYVSESGDVCFSVASYAQYGRLSNQKIESLSGEQRIEKGAKASANDFVLWKMSKPGEPEWPSPWGNGRPGWHIECSAMSIDLLGETFDLHGGGLDLKFPHHENEIAQSCCATGNDFAQHWMHVGPLRVNDEKMSKSLGNFVTIDSALADYHPELIRWYLLKTHYRMPLNFTREGVQQAQRNLLGAYLNLRGETGSVDESNQHWQSFNNHLEDDLNTAGAMSVMHAFESETKTADDRAILKAMLQRLGLGNEDPITFLQSGATASHVTNMLAEREAARTARNFDLADQIRNDLVDQGIMVLDSPQGTFWYNDRVGLNNS